MKIFFAIPFFKNSEYLKKTLQSLIDQTNQNWSAIVFDDSVIPEEKKAAQLVVQDLDHPNIKILHNDKNLGLAKNWNQGLHYASSLSSDFFAVTILHADDLLLPKYVESMLNAIKQNPGATGFFCKTKIIDDSGRSKFSFADEYKKTLLPKVNQFELGGAQGIEALIPGNFIFCPTLCFVITKLGSERFNENLKQVPDFELILRLLLRGHSLVGLYEHPLYLYRRHSQNTTQVQTKSLLRFEEERDLYLSLSRSLKEKNHLILSNKAKQMRVVKLNLIYNATTALLSLNLKDCLRFIQFMLQLP